MHNKQDCEGGDKIIINNNLKHNKEIHTHIYTHTPNFQKTNSKMVN